MLFETFKEINSFLLPAYCVRAFCIVGKRDDGKVDTDSLFILQHSLHGGFDLGDSQSRIC